MAAQFIPRLLALVLLAALSHAGAPLDGKLFASVLDVYKEAEPWQPSHNCTGCASGSQCCYDPATGPSSYACFKVSACSDISDSGMDHFLKLEEITFTKPAVQFPHSPLLNCSGHVGGCQSDPPVTSIGQQMFQQVIFGDTKGALILSYTLGANHSIERTGMCKIHDRMVVTFGDQRTGQLYGIGTDGVSLQLVQDLNQTDCRVSLVGSLPMPVTNASDVMSQAASCTYHHDSSELLCVGISHGNEHHTIFGYNVSARRPTGNWTLEANLAFSQLDVSQGWLLIGGSLNCGQQPASKCLIGLDLTSGSQKNFIFNATDVELGVLYTTSYKHPWVLWQTQATMKTNYEQIIVFDWTNPSGELVYNSSALARPCAPGSFECETTGFHYIDA